MKLTNFLDYIKNIGTKDVFRVLEDLGASLEAWAKQLGFDAWIMFLAGLAATVLVGFFGYKMIKVLMGLGLAYVGYFVGVEIFTVAKETLTWLPGWSVYILGALIGILFGRQICSIYSSDSATIEACLKILWIILPLNLAPHIIHKSYRHYKSAPYNKVAQFSNTTCNGTV